MRYSRKIGPPIVSAAVATLVLTNFATVSIVKDNTADQVQLFGSIWPIALTSAVAVILVMSFLYKSLVDLVDELEAREANAQHQALHDQLTGLANRALLEDRLSQALTRYRRSGEQVALLMLDLDRFKQVNDTLGHNAGDKLVQEVGERLRSLLRETDTVARIGGDEFAIVQVSPKGEADVRRLCERIISVIRKPFLIGDREARVGVSIGAVFATKEVVRSLRAAAQGRHHHVPRQGGGPRLLPSVHRGDGRRRPAPRPDRDRRCAPSCAKAAGSIFTISPSSTAAAK